MVVANWNERQEPQRQQPATRSRVVPAAACAPAYVSGKREPVSRIAHGLQGMGVSVELARRETETDQRIDRDRGAWYTAFTANWRTWP